jgi:nicotinamidase-related amidase
MSTLEMERQAAAAGAFLEWLDRWYSDLPSASLREDVIDSAGGAQAVGVMVVDLLVGFSTEGPLASPRVAALGLKAARFLQAAWDAGIRTMVLAMDAHPPDSPEFAAFPPHCVRGTREAELMPELRALPFAAEMLEMRKGSLNVGHEPEMRDWHDRQRDLRAWIVIGDCTDLCVYQSAMHLRLQANARGEEVRIWVPADLADTYDLPVEAARRIGAMPHDGDLMHRLFLYHMALNGISVVRELRP